MTKSDDLTLEQFNLQTSHYGFSAASLDDLGSAEYTLISLCVDRSSSVMSFVNEIEKTMNAIIESCRKSPRKDNLLIRLCTFGSDFSEVHGFKPLQSIKDDEYNNSIKCGGMTALFDATENAIEATGKYGKTLTDNDYQVNAINFVITDGGNNNSITGTPNSIKKVIGDIRKGETLESITTVLIGINTNPGLDQLLNTFKNEANLDEYISIADADAKSLAKLQGWVSQSISTVSQSLGAGQSQPLPTF